MSEGRTSAAFGLLALLVVLACVTDAPQQRGADGSIVVAPEFERGVFGR